MNTPFRCLLTSGLEWDWPFDWWPVSVNARRYVWHKQALFKGRSSLYGTTWAGWGLWEWALPFVGKPAARLRREQTIG